jgi:hypothetical protein
MTDNLSLWKSVERTDPAHVKPITGKSYKGSSPAPHWIVRKATETFGPIGIGWGFDIKLSEFVPTDAGVMHFATVRVWYIWDGKRGEAEHIGGTAFAGKRKDGTPFADEDAPKKSVTDALVKALSMIGFAGDIFLGRWDDSKYQAELREEFSDKPPSTPPANVKAAKAQLKTLSEHIDRTGRSFAKLLKHYGVDTVEELTAAEAAEAIEMLCGIADRDKAA